MNAQLGIYYGCCVASHLACPYRMVESFGVLDDVRAQGLIESRQGVGAFVAAARQPSEPLQPVSSQLLEGDDTIRNMFEVRAVLESQVGALS